MLRLLGLLPLHLGPKPLNPGSGVGASAHPRHVYSHLTSPSPPGPQEVLVSVAPKKANWDLRRDIADKLGRLERRTQAAMVRLMQQEEAARLAEEGGQQD